MVKQKSKTWVCTICSQSFTRNFSAKRHDINLHGGNGEYVRYMDYEIGRVQGKYYQNDPAFFKKYSYNYGIPNVNKPTPNFGSEFTQSDIPNVNKPTPNFGSEFTQSDIPNVNKPTPNFGSEFTQSDIPNVNKPTPNFGSEFTQSDIPNNEIDSYNYVNSDSFTPPNYDEPPRNTSIFAKAEEIMEIVDQINNLAKDVLNEYQIKQYTRWLLTPYYTNYPHPKTAVEKKLNRFKKTIAITRLKDLFSG